MQKLKKKNNNNLLNYDSFLKNNYLKEDKLNFKNILFKNYVLYKSKKLNLNIIETNNNNFFLSNINKEIIYTIQKKYQNQLLLNFKLNYNIISFFNKLIFQNLLKKKKIIKGRIINGKNNKIYLYIFGYIFIMLPKNLNLLCNNKKKTFNSFLLKKKGGFSFWKTIKVKQLIKSYKLRHLNFNINIIDSLKKKKKIIFSRISYLERLFKNKELKFNKILYKKSSFSRKLYVQKINPQK